MHKFSIVIILALFVVAAAPWLVSSCSPRPLLPPQLKEERDQYETRVAAAQQATLDGQRAATSPPPRVVPIGTINPTAAASTVTPTLAIPTAPLTTTNPVSQPIQTEAVTTALPTAAGANSTVKILSRATVTQTATPISAVVVVRSTETANSSVLTKTNDLTVTSTPTVDTGIATVNPRGMSPIEDIITEEMLREQVQKSNSDGSFSDIAVRITPEGLRVTGNAAVTLLQQPFTMRGTFIVENESLAVKVESILLNGADVTSRYRSQLEDEIRWQLYQLLPQRFVQSFTLADGQVIVESLKR